MSTIRSSSSFTAAVASTMFLASTDEVNAAPVTFDFTNSGPAGFIGTNASYNSNGETLNVSASLSSPLYADGNGIRAGSSFASLILDLDGSDDYEITSLTGISFSNIFGPSQGELSFEGPLGPVSETFSVPTGTSFTQAFNLGAIDGDEPFNFADPNGNPIYVTNATLEIQGDSDPLAPVPLPGGLPLLAAGVGALALLRRSPLEP